MGTLSVGVMDVDLHRAEVTSDRAAFEDLYAVNYPRLAGYCYGLLSDRQQAAEVTQEAFARLFVRIVSVKDPVPWLYLVATNLCRDHWRAQERDRNLDARLQARTSGSVPAHDPWIRDLVDRLPERLRTVVLLHYYADLPVAEIAHVLHRPTGTVKRRLMEARTALATSARSQ